jgi:hypothetical protein
MTRHFQFNGFRYKYYEPAPFARKVELPVAHAQIHAAEFLNWRILEVGDVLSNWYDAQHDILDKYEKRDGVINADAALWRPEEPYDFIACISTFEHIGEVAYEKINAPFKPLAAIYNLLLYSLKPDRSMFLTVPVGRRKHLDKYIRDLPFTWLSAMKRVKKDTWEEVRVREALKCKWNKPFKKANAVLMGEIYRK